jgi:hypothetical protein
MLDQQLSFKVGEQAPQSGSYCCAACDARGAGSAVQIDASHVFPFCATCKEAGKEEPDQLWIRAADRDSWHRRQATRWREMWKS